MYEISKPILNNFKYILDSIESNISIDVHYILLNEIKRQLIGEISNTDVIFWFGNIGI
jgi:hypothetical protein